MTSLEPTHTVAEVAAALDESERYVRDRCRQRDWPHLRGARGRISFTAQQYAEILQIRSAPAQKPESPRWSFAPRSGRRAS